MHALDILGDPVRRRIVEILARGDASAGELTATITAEFGITQPAVSNHLRVLRDSGFARSEPNGSRRVYALAPERVGEAQAWMREHLDFWNQRLDALETELRRGRKDTP